MNTTEGTSATAVGGSALSEGLGAVSEARCWCHACTRDTAWPFALKMIVCPDCGNKRCPKASNHTLACTDSNDPGQLGSVYGGLCDFPHCACDETEPAFPADGSCARGLPKAPNVRAKAALPPQAQR